MRVHREGVQAPLRADVRGPDNSVHQVHLDTAKNDAAASASKNGSDYGEVNSKLFFVSGKLTDKGLPPCTKDYGSPGKGQSKFGPVCSPEPGAAHFGAYGHGTDKRLHLNVMVSVGLIGEEGDVHLSHALELAKEIISAKIH